jgi:GT2 family glycosyltransferase
MFYIIIPTLNNFNYLKLCVESLKKNSKYTHQIIVHINVGADETRNFLISNKIDFTFTEQNSGLCTGVNLASKKAKYEYIMYAHDDFYFCPDWDVSIYDEIIKIGHKKFYLSSTLINTHNIDSLNCGTDFYDFDENKLLINYKKHKFSDFQGSTWAPHVVHKDYWDKVGGFSEEFFPGAGSDPDFNFKLWKNGVRIFKTVGNSKVYHFESKTLRDKKKYIYFDASSIGSVSSKIFLKKWGISIKFFKKHYLKANSLYAGELNKPNINMVYLIELIICKFKYLYLKYLFSKFSGSKKLNSKK